MRRENAKAARLLPWLTLAAAAALSLALLWLYGGHNLTGDISSEMVLAALNNSEGTLLSPNWYYSNELRVISPVQVYQLGLTLFSSWHAARVFAVAVTMAVMLAAFLYMARGMGVGDAAVYCAAALCLPFCADYSFVFCYFLFYAPYFALICLALGLIVRLDGSRRGAVRMLLLLPLGFAAGLNGVRLLMALAAPLGLSCLLLFIARARRCESLREALGTAEARRLFAAAALALAIAAGYAVNATALSARYSFTHYEEMRLEELSFDTLLVQLQGIAAFFGYRPGGTVFSFKSLSSVAGLGCLCLCAQGARSLLRRFGALGEGKRLLVAFALCAALSGMAINVVTGTTVVNYFMFGLILLVLTMFCAWEEAECRPGALRTLGMLALTGLFALQAAAYYKEEWRREPAFYEDAADFLTENGYERGYATFWYATPMTEATDGALELYTVADWESGELMDFLQEKRHLESPPEGRVFALIGWADEAPEELAEALAPYLAGETAAGRVYGFDSDAALREAFASVAPQGRWLSFYGG